MCGRTKILACNNIIAKFSCANFCCAVRLQAEAKKLGFKNLEELEIAIDEIHDKIRYVARIVKTWCILVQATQFYVTFYCPCMEYFGIGMREVYILQ